MKTVIRNAAFVAACMLAPGGSALAQTSPAVQREIVHLLDYVASPGCQFNRNGTWYQGAKAREHLKEKYEYLEKRHMVTNAESFIERAATSSSMSGRAYLVRCGGGAAMPSGAWLTTELKRFRSIAAPAPK